MDSSEINKLIKDKEYLGTFPRDLLPSLSKKKFGLIINTDPSTKPGQHWVAVFKDANEVQYFDSYGLPPLHCDIIDFLDSHGQWNYNRITLQSFTSKVCGHYCVVYLWCRFEGWQHCDFMNLFKCNRKRNDIVVKEIVQNGRPLLQWYYNLGSNMWCD